MKYILTIAALLAASLVTASATFMVNTSFSGETKLFFDVANSNVTHFTAFVGGQSPSLPHVAIDTIGPVNTGSGFSTIKPVTSGTLTQLTFTPANSTLFSDFSFRGQLEGAAGGVLIVTVQDAQGHPAQMFTFSGLGANADFGRLGINSTDGETIQSVTISSNFEEFKQVEISFASGVPSVPDGGSTVVLLALSLIALGVTQVKYIRRA